MNKYYQIEIDIDKKGTVERQSIKTAEAIVELIKGMSKDNIGLIKDGIGDVFITLVIGNILDENLCLEECYTEAKGNFKRFSIEDEKYAISCLTHAIIDIIRNGYCERSLYFGLVDLMAIADIYNLDFKDCVESAYAVLEDI